MSLSCGLACMFCFLLEDANGQALNHPAGLCSTWFYMMMLNPCNLEWCDHPLVCQITEGPKVFPSDGLRNIKVYIWPNHCACPHERPKMVCHYDADFDLLCLIATGQEKCLSAGFRRTRCFAQAPTTANCQNNIMDFGWPFHSTVNLTPRKEGLPNLTSIEKPTEHSYSKNSKRQNVLNKSTEMGPTVAHRLPIMVQLRSFGSLSLNRKWCSSASLITLPHHVLFPSCWGWTSGSIRIRGATGAACLFCLLLSSLASFCQPGRKLFWFFIDFWEWTNLWAKWHTFKTV